jgi:hypothetical protein
VSQKPNQRLHVRCLQTTCKFRWNPFLRSSLPSSFQKLTSPRSYSLRPVSIDVLARGSNTKIIVFLLCYPRTGSVPFFLALDCSVLSPTCMFSLSSASLILGLHSNVRTSIKVGQREYVSKWITLFYFFLRNSIRTQILVLA